MAELDGQLLARLDRLIEQASRRRQAIERRMARMDRCARDIDANCKELDQILHDIRVVVDQLGTALGELALAAPAPVPAPTVDVVEPADPAEPPPAKPAASDPAGRRRLARPRLVERVH